MTFKKKIDIRNDHIAMKQRVLAASARGAGKSPLKHMCDAPLKYMCDEPLKHMCCARLIARVFSVTFFFSCEKVMSRYCPVSLANVTFFKGLFSNDLFSFVRRSCLAIVW